MTEDKRLKFERKPANAQSHKPGFKQAFQEGDAQAKPKRLTLSLTPERHRKVKTYASQNETTITALFNDYIDNL